MSRAGTLTGPGREAVFVALDAPDAPPRTAVVLCPPFGWEEVCSYRPRREWAAHLAGEGRLALRLQFPGSGDSAGAPMDPGRLGAWTRAAGDAVSWARARPGIERVAVIGLGLGGLVAWLAAAEGAPIDDLVLWGTPSRGSRLVRELHAFAALQASQRGAPAPEPGATVEIAGHLLSGETVGEISAVDLTARPLPAPHAQRVLTLDRDGLAPDPRLARHLAEAGVSYTIGPGPGWGRMTAEPQAATAPLSTFATVSAWLAEVAAPSTLPAVASGVTLTESVTLAVAGRPVEEVPVRVPYRGLDLSGVLSSPAGPARPPIALLYLNAGAIDRQGPNRIWVEAARRWAARGVPSLRLDVEGIGDADGRSGEYVSDAGLYVPRLVDQVLAGADALEHAAPGAQIVTVGLCSGAYWGFHAALRDDAVRSVVMLNPRALFWRDELEHERNARFVRRVVLSLESWRRVARRDVAGARLLAILRLIGASALRSARTAVARRPPAREDDRIGDALDRLRDAGVRVSMAFGEREPLRHELAAGGYLAQLGRWPQLQVDELPGAVHTLQSVDAQAAAHAIIDREVERAIERAGP
jgi:alpha/beta superfamily hydrolase